MRAFLKARVPGLAPAVRYAKSVAWRALPARYKFSRIYRSRTWGSADASLSGMGSSLRETAVIRARLPDLFERLSVRSLLDIPCGDFFWMKEVDLAAVRYIGADIVPEIIDTNRRVFGDLPSRKFVTLDITRDPLPAVDLILCRDCLVHLSNKDVLSAVANIKHSGSTYLLATTFPAHGPNEDIVTGYWRPLNLESRPFTFPKPMLTVREDCPAPGYDDKSLVLWRISDL